MQEKRIEVVGPVDRVNRAFVTKDSLKEGDIDEIAQDIVDSIKEKLGDFESITKEEIATIIYTLQPSYILSHHTLAGEFSIKSLTTSGNLVKLTWRDKNGELQSDTVSKQELEPSLQKIRLAVLSKLSLILPKNINAEIVKQSLRGGVVELESGKFYKREERRGDPKYLALENTNKVRALKNLHKIPEKSPFIFYGTESVDQRGGAISKAIDNLTTIEESLRQPEKPLLSEVVGYFIDVINGHKFLLSHDLVLFDTGNHNIGIRKDKNAKRGIMFDLGGLRRKDDKTEYLVPTETKPSERLTGKTEKDDSPATEANIVYELGEGLGTIRRSYSREAPANQLLALQNLSKEMTERDPKRRPTLQQVEERLEEVQKVA